MLGLDYGYVFVNLDHHTAFEVLYVVVTGLHLKPILFAISIIIFCC